ncbi:MAG: GH116 family glycosyl hydrolase [Candidatus Roizmanbacteria bacterium]|nr:GH116 family glycosyl hydrolase [Candidatus Roizmanbacteria bacterium]
MPITTDYTKAVSIASRSLRACVTPQGIIAGTHHFVDLWARDSLFAVWGALEIGEYSAVRNTIDAFLHTQRSDGLIAHRILRARVSPLRYFGVISYYKNPVANFRSYQSGGLVLDGGLLTIIAVARYVRATNDIRYVKNRYNSLFHAIEWHLKRFKGDVLSEWYLCEWMDAVYKRGSTLYTNTLYAKALHDMSYLAQTVGKKRDAYIFEGKANFIEKKLNLLFWNGTYYVDWISRFQKKHAFFNSHANMLAVNFKIATPVQAKSICTYALHKCVVDFTLESSTPRYPWWRIPPYNHIAGIGDYHNGLRWLQPGIHYALALYTLGEARRAQRMMRVIAEHINHYDGVYEVYEKSGEPVRRLLYKAEEPFAWSAGLFLYATGVIMKSKLFKHDCSHGTIAIKKDCEG